MSKATILVADDFLAGRALLEAILDSLDYAVITAQDGQEAVRTVQTKRPDAILMDIEMPVMNGYEACRILKQDPRTTGIPLLMVSGLDEMDDIRKALREGADGYIMKPINSGDVATKVAELLELAKTGKLPGQPFIKARGPEGTLPP